MNISSLKIHKDFIVLMHMWQCYSSIARTLKKKRKKKEDTLLFL